MNSLDKTLNILLPLIPISLLISPPVNSILIGLVFALSLVKVYKESAISLISENKMLAYIGICYCVFLLFHIIGLFYTENMGEALSLIKKRAPLFIIPIIFYINYKKINYEKIGTYFTNGVTIACLFTNFNSLYDIYINEYGIDAFYTIYIRFVYEGYMFYGIHPPYFGVIINISIVLIFKVVMIDHKITVLELLKIFVLVLNLFLVSSQMSVGVFLLITMIFFILSLKKYLKIIYLRSFLVISILALLLIVINGKWISETIIEKLEITNRSNIVHRVNHLYNKGDLTRYRNWESGAQVIKENPFFGVGTGDAVDEMQIFRDKKTMIYKKRMNSHNQYIEEMVRFGFLGGVFFLMLIFLLLFYTFTDVVGFSIILIFVFSLFTESILNRQVGVVFFAFFISYLVFRKQSNRLVNEI
ncbi:O-antigen ligase domain-containing protein [Aquimarina sp. BL5]|uniref:O-antigen ligase family protein n=1 Tax=Aquimarina sp. BL5 TaxID=1714860 RepID=UPI000E4C758B|nr:O-antigen ligase family protein [Aquimarina sp. BL5]AXT51972.1 O-antigen ligase domain-containing protein [Aquimarina sp. BL5]RKN03241.1 O-antigen ligase domain-containing protein [Aquimarina sp. BL5]